MSYTSHFCNHPNSSSFSNSFNSPSYAFFIYPLHCLQELQILVTAGGILIAFTSYKTNIQQNSKPATVLVTKYSFTLFYHLESKVSFPE